MANDSIATFLYPSSNLIAFYSFCLLALQTAMSQVFLSPVSENLAEEEAQQDVANRNSITHFLDA